MPLSEPLNVLSRNTGNGTIEVQWGAPITGTPGGYQVWIATTLGGVYTHVVTVPASQRWAKIVNLPVGYTIYTKVRAVEDPEGFGTGAGPFSDVARDAVASRGVTTLTFVGQAGDVIPSGAIFTASVGGSLLGFQVGTGGVLR